MTEQEFSNLKEGDSVYDYKTSKHRRYHVFGMVRGKCKVTGDIKIYIEGMEESLPLSNCFDFDLFDPKDGDTSTLPFY